MNESFIFYSSFFEAIEELDDKKRLKMYDLIAKFALKNEEPEKITGICKQLFTLIKPQIIANNAKKIKYLKDCENGKMGAEYGCKGGRPKKNEQEKKTPGGFLENNPQENPINVNANVNVNEKVNVNENIIINDVDEDVSKNQFKNISLDDVPEIIKNNKNIKNPCAYWATLPDDAKDRLKNQKPTKTQSEIMLEKTQNVLKELHEAQKYAVPPPQCFKDFRRNLEVESK